MIYHVWCGVINNVTDEVMNCFIVSLTAFLSQPSAASKT